VLFDRRFSNSTKTGLQCGVIHFYLQGTIFGDNLR
jgi:hypothetical protein